MERLWQCKMLITIKLSMIKNDNTTGDPLYRFPRVQHPQMSENSCGVREWPRKCPFSNYLFLGGGRGVFLEI